MGTAGKKNSKYMCTNCGAETLKWMGRCPQCGEWNTLEERVEAPILPNYARSVVNGDAGGRQARPLSFIDLTHHERFLLGIPEVDRPLGGGIVPGSVILWGGEPGIGKSTLIMQVCKEVAGKIGRVLYCSGEESELQLKMRAQRLQFNDEKCLIYSESDLNAILLTAEKVKPAMMVIDSIQTMFIAGNTSPMGSPAQIRDCTSVLVKFAKANNTAVMIIGHVTKEGNLAGPRILEHMVDVVLYLEGDRKYQFRVLRTVKNRFGSTEESGLFVMEERGLKGIKDPSQYLLKERSEQVPGAVVVACMEGLRPMLIEIQALIVHSVLSVPRRISAGYDYNRMIILLAVLEKRGHIPLFTDDVYLNVAGGIHVRETAVDLAIILALFSVKKDVPVPQGLMALGEIGLTGEVMPISHIGIRTKEAVKMNFKQFIVPERNRKEIEKLKESRQFSSDIRFYYVKNINEVIRLIS